MRHRTRSFHAVQAVRNILETPRFGLGWWPCDWLCSIGSDRHARACAVSCNPRHRSGHRYCANRPVPVVSGEGATVAVGGSPPSQSVGGNRRQWPAHTAKAASILSAAGTSKRPSNILIDVLSIIVIAL